MTDPLPGYVLAVSRDDAHRFRTPDRGSITLIAGMGVDRDAHTGATVQRLSPGGGHEPLRTV